MQRASRVRSWMSRSLKGLRLFWRQKPSRSGAQRLYCWAPSRRTACDDLTSPAGLSFPMRILVGYGFIEHGFAKLSRGPDAFAGGLQQLGVPLPHAAPWLTIGTELIGGLALLLGAFVVWASIPTASVLLVAMITV